ncbi:hypothetical protein A5717_23530 [Mycolicibacterium porcinum]|nr:hypothetical protein A5717_23530 [Mycolicibacterium porcinum]
MIQLALPEGSEEAYIDIRDRIDECQRQVDLPSDDEVHIDQTRIREANRQVLTDGQVEKIAQRLGALGEGLNKRRVGTLVRQRKRGPARWTATCGSTGSGMSLTPTTGRGNE